jgi:hypothetical protein
MPNFRSYFAIFLCLVFALFAACTANADIISRQMRQIQIERSRKARRLHEAGKKNAVKSKLLQAGKKSKKEAPAWINPQKPRPIGFKASVEDVVLIDDTIDLSEGNNFALLYEKLKDCRCGSPQHIAIKKKLLKHAIKTGNIEAVRNLSNFLEKHKNGSSISHWKLLLAIILFAIGLWQLRVTYKLYKKDNQEG